MFELSGITKAYPARHGVVNALLDVSLSIPAGGFMVVSGPSGSGKTTLLLTLGGLIHPTRGSVRFRNAELYAMSPSHLAAFRNLEIGFVLQTFNLVPYLTALENVQVPMLFNRAVPADAQARAEALLERVGLADRADHLPRELSIGQQQRVAIARALANDPKVILADEPTGNLDPALATEILEILSRLNRDEGRTVIMVTHSPTALQYGTLALRLEAGRIVT